MANIPSKLSLVHSILVWYAAPAQFQSDLLCDEDRDALRADFVRAFVDRLGGKPDALSLALSDSQDHLLTRLVWGSNRAGQLRPPLPWTGWRDFAPTILEAAESRPEVMLSQLAELVAIETQTFDEDGHTQRVSRFLPNVCTSLFGDKNVVDLFRGVSPVILQRATPGSPLRVMIDLAESPVPSSVPEPRHIPSGGNR